MTQNSKNDNSIRIIIPKYPKDETLMQPCGWGGRCDRLLISPKINEDDE